MEDLDLDPALIAEGLATKQAHLRAVFMYRRSEGYRNGARRRHPEAREINDEIAALTKHIRKLRELLHHLRTRMLLLGINKRDVT